MDRIQNTKKEKVEAELLTRSDGDQNELNHILVDLPAEKIVDALSCAQLTTSLSDFFEFLSEK